MVGTTLQDSASPAQNFKKKKKPITTREQMAVRSVFRKHPTDHFLHIKQRLIQEEGCDKSTAEFLIDSWQPATRKVYNIYISKWNTFCLLENVDKLNPPVFKVCKFLKMLSQQKLSFGAVNAARCALSVLMPDFSKGNSIGKNCRAVHTAYLQNPPKPKYKPFWDVNLVFKVIRTWGANSKMSLRLLSEKLVVLFLLVSGQRGQVIVAIDVDAVVNTDDGLEITLNKPMKTARTGESLQKIRCL